MDWLGSFPREKPTVIPKAYRGLGVLLVDHNTSSLMHIASVLEGHYYKVTTTELADVALSIFRERTEQFDLVMADMYMPHMNIFVFLRNIMTIRDMPIILISFKLNREIVWISQREGAVHMLEKPISPEQLKNVWQHVYKKRRSLRIEFENADYKNIKEEVESSSRIAIVNDLQSINNENSRYDTKGKEKQIDEGNSEVEEYPARESQSIATKELNEPGGSKRKGVDDDYDEKSREESDLEENSGRKGKRKYNSLATRNPRMAWTPDLHLKFTEAVSVLGAKEARPKKVLEMMNVPNLTQRQVASHLQKYRDRMQHIADNEAFNQLLPRSKMAKSTLNFYIGNRSPQQRGQTSSVEFPERPQIPSYEAGASSRKFILPKPLFSPRLNIDFSSYLAQSPYLYHTNKQNGVQIYDHSGFHELIQTINLSTPMHDINWIIKGKGKLHIEEQERTNNEGYMYNSTYFPYSNQFPMTFGGLRREMDFGMNEASSSRSIFPSAYPINFTEANLEQEAIIGSGILNPPSSDFAELDELMKVLEGEDGLEDLSGQPSASDIDKYCEWLETPLIENSTDQEQLNFDKDSHQQPSDGARIEDNKVLV